MARLPIPTDMDTATAAEVAVVLDTTPAGLAQMRYRGTGPRFVHRGRRILYRWSDVRSYLEGNTCQHRRSSRCRCGMTQENSLGPDAATAEAEPSHHRNCTAECIVYGPHERFDSLAANARRYGASRRMPPTSRCGCIRDPEYDRHTCGREISDHQAEAAAAAIIRLDALGFPGLLDDSTCRTMYRVGYRHLATNVHRRTAGAA